MILAEIFHKYLTCALDEGDLHDTQWREGWVGTVASLDAVEK
jgi:hypothetical protein